MKHGTAQIAHTHTQITNSLCVFAFRYIRLDFVCLFQIRSFKML